MRPAYYLVLLFVITITALSAQNQMALMNTLYGEFNGDEFGSQMLAMDYNGDGYDDLIVLSNMWNGTGVHNSEYFLGKIYFYWGGPVFDNIPDFVLEGQQQNDYTGYPTNIPGMCNAGDMNADGIDDLAITRSYDNVGGIYRSLDLYLGRAIPQTIPDYVITYPQATLFPRWLGDINNDGKADLAINGLYDVSNSTPFSYIWTDLASAPVLFRSSIYRGAFFLSGVGDVNNDGYADSFMGTPLSNSYDVKAALYYGDATASMSDSMVISEYLYQEAQLNARTLGDINGDGFDDFIGYSDWVYHYIWLGSPELDSIPDLQLSLNTDDHEMITFSRGARLYAVHGDLNGDGFDDFVCSDPGAHGWNGQAGVWLGGPNVNATVDLVLDPPTDWQWRNFGHSKAMGDFNGDGLSDLALSCPWWRDFGFLDTGRVYVYAGNAQLADTTVSTDDPIAPALTTPKGEIYAYPNPGQIKNNAISISLKGELYSRSGIYSYRLYNIRGQELKHGSISNSELNNRQFSLNISELRAGVYQIVVLKDGHITNSKRIIIY